jgi:trans-aconitate methyltransferase
MSKSPDDLRPDAHALPHESIIDLYERHAADFDQDRSRSLQEKSWLDRFLANVPSAGRVLDLGCGMGEPIAAYILAAGRSVTGVDASSSLIALARARFPDAEWLVNDMRRLALHRRFAGIIAWDSFFHLHMNDQRAMFRRFADHAEAGAPLLFTSGPAYGETVGSYRGEPLYHASLHSSEYRELLEMNGFELREHVTDDAQCGDHTVWLATYTLRQW